MNVAVLTEQLRTEIAQRNAEIERLQDENRRLKDENVRLHARLSAEIRARLIGEILSEKAEGGVRFGPGEEFLTPQSVPRRRGE